MTTAEMWMVVSNLVMALAMVGSLFIAWVAMRKKTEVDIASQPLTVKIIQSMHEQFAARQDFLDHIRDNDKQRGILHRRLDDSITDYNRKFQQLPNEIVALLRNTGNLK